MSQLGNMFFKPCRTCRSCRDWLLGRIMLKSRFAVALIVACLAFSSFADEEASDETGWYSGVAAQLVLPQGGARMHRLGGGAARVGYYFTGSLALEAEAAWLENVVGLSARALWHLHGWEEFNMLFGYERFDPFLTLGARGWIHDGQVGPSAGVGAFYYLTDSWALRFDADVTLGLDTDVETAFTLSAGLQYSF